MVERFDRELLRGSMDLIILSVLAEQPQYGYLIQRRIHEVTRDQVQLQAGTLYPLLHRLEAEKLIRSRWEDSTGRRRKWYELTSAGRRRLEKQAQQWSRYADCLRQLLGPVLASCPKPA